MDAEDRELGVLVVGTGFLGAQRAAATVRTKGLRLVAVTDLDEALAERVAARFGVVAVPSLEVGLESGGVHVVVIATPHGDHAGAVRRSLEAGKHVLCEKPLAIRAEDARGLAILADERRLKLATGLNHRFYPPIQDAMDLVGRWSIGRVEGVRAQIGHSASPEFLKSWHTEVALSGGGTLMDNGPHACDLIRRFLGEVVLAKGFVRQDVHLPSGCETEAHGLYRNHDGAVAEIHSSWALRAGYLTVEVRGTEGHLRIETAPWRLSGQLADGRRVDRRYLADRVAERVYQARFGCERSIVREMEAFVSNPSTSMRPNATGWDGCRVTEMIQAVYQSDRIGDEVHLKPLLVHLPSGARRRAIRDREHRR
ncbi:Gfo/Idh/MocA family protein [Tundrisphaera lichenicola]|uniref:Gfo/Idh/MocA family protein n=1 Tax=Tundrisphaera lichenicola TaxID=2029860 RepID=UPI003EBF81AE